MNGPLRLVIFDVDGTLVDSQSDILAAMTAAFDSVEAPVPSRMAILGVVGLSLDVIFPRLAPELTPSAHHEMVAAYKAAYVTLRKKAGVVESSPLYPGAREMLEALHGIPEVLLGVATGKSRRGLNLLLDGHGLQQMFVTQQVADFHPSKPHPSMIQQAMSDAGVAVSDTVMIGDTSFDMEMAQAAGVRGVGVSWGYHGRDRLTGASTVIDRFEALPEVLEQFWGVTV